tara:strand:+ start:1624 stop:2058 length:435 start_codon:yes stop_codon:yes gene_type:complete
MPRLPVDGKKVIEHRYTLGQYERDQLDTLITGITVRNVATPTVALLNDVTGLIALTAIAEALGFIDLAGLAKKAGGAGEAWIISVTDGVFNSVSEALDDLQNKIDETLDIELPGEQYVKDTISLGDRLWVTAQILLTNPLRSVL